MLRRTESDKPLASGPSFLGWPAVAVLLKGCAPMSLPAMKPDRRRSPRKNLEGLAYVNFEPENGGIILNVSEDGLCFCAVAPVPAEGAVSFSFLANGNRIDAEGSVVWTDRARKTGGLRFTHLPAEARELTSRWMLPTSRPSAVERLPIAPRPEGTVESVARPVLIRPRATLQALSRWGRAPLRWTEFSRGLAVGLLVALFVAGAFMFQARRQQIGSMLIRLGERFESAPQPSSTSSAQSLQAATAKSASPKGATIKIVVPAGPASFGTRAAATTKVVAPVRPAPDADTRGNAAGAPASPVTARNSGASEKLPLLRSAKAIPHPPSTTASVTPKKSGVAGPVQSANSTPSGSAGTTSQATPGAAVSATSQPAPARPPSVAPSPGNSNDVTAKAADSSPDNTEEVMEINSGMPFGKYLTVGKFKDPQAAGETQRQLTNLGLRAAIVPKSLLWMKSYEVLVGPYRDAATADDARRNLQSHGFKPHSLAQRSRRLTLVASWSNPYRGNEDDNKDFVVSWEAYSSDATVKLVSRGQTSASVVGKWVKLPARSDYTSITYTPSVNGKRNLVAIQFRGMTQAVSLPESAHGLVF